MTQERWSEVDDYLVAALGVEDGVLRGALAASEAAGLPAISVTATQGRFLSLLVRIAGARSVLEIGTLGGYSTIWLARGLSPGGRVVSLESEPRHADVARSNLALAGLSAVVEVRLGRALDTLAELGPTDGVPYDLVFVDADKQNNAEYVRQAIRLGRPGTVLVVDNVVRAGRVIDPDAEDPAVPGVRAMFDLLTTERRLEATALQTVGSKGYDGFLLATVRD